MKTIAVIGGGITGVTTAYALAKHGFSVTLFEKQRYAAMETSFANGGQLSASNAEVWNHSSTILKGLKWMLKGDAPLLLNPKPSWHKLSWFCEFLAAIPHYQSNTIETVRLAIAAREHLFSWGAEEGIDFDSKQKGILHSRASAPLVSLLDDETKLVTSRLGDDRFRVAGTAEFNGYNKDIRADRIRPLVDWVQACFPGISTQSVVPWAGLRPMMPNMLPRVGRGNKPCVFYNTGHGHLGWTLSAVTANMIGDIVQQALGSATVASRPVALTQAGI